MSQNFSLEQAQIDSGLCYRWHKHVFPDAPLTMAKVTFEMFSDACISTKDSFL